MGTIGSRFQQIRESMRLNQEAFASELGVSRNTLSRWEKDQGTPSAKALEVLREKYSINVEWLLSGEGDMKSWPSSLKVEFVPNEHSVPVSVSKSRRAFDAIDFVFSDALETINMLGLKVENDRLSLIYYYLVNLVSIFDRHELRIIGGAITRWAMASVPLSKPDPKPDPNAENYCDIQEIKAATGLSRATILRKLKASECPFEKRNVPGRGKPAHWYRISGLPEDWRLRVLQLRTN